MPSMLDDTELDARWRAGLEAACEPGEVMTAESRVSHRVAHRRRTRVGAAAGALVVVGALIAGVVITTTGTDSTRVNTVTQPSAGSAVGTVIPGRPPGVAMTYDALVAFHAPDPVRRQVFGRRVAVVLEALGPGSWTLQIDDVPGSELTVHGENQLNAESTLLFDLEPGEHPITLTGASRNGPEQTFHTELTVVAPPAQPAGEPIATISVVAEPTLTLTVSPLTVPAGIIEIQYSDTGGTHQLVIDGVPGFRMNAPNGDSPYQTLKVELTPGQYVFSCFLPGHREAGERATLTVT